MKPKFMLRSNFSSRKIIYYQVIAFFTIAFLFSNCSKDVVGDSNLAGNNVVIDIEGVVDITNVELQASSSIQSLYQENNNLNNSDRSYYSFDGLNAFTSSEFTSMNENFVQNENQPSGYVTPSKPIIKSATVTPLSANYLYRVVLYDKSTNPSTFVSSTLGTAGSALSIPIEKGKNYDYAVFSFNSTQDPGESNSTLTTTNTIDLLYANGTFSVPGFSGDGENVTIPLKITLAHKLACVSVEVSAANYPGNITALTASLGAANYFQTGTMELRTGNISNLTQSNVSMSMTFATPSASTRIATYYTAGSTAVNPFAVTLNTFSMLSTDATPVARTLSAPQTFTWTTLVPAAGKKFRAIIDFVKLDETKLKIFSVGGAGSGITTNTNSGIYKVLKSSSNFGPSASSIVKTNGLNWVINTTNTATSGALTASAVSAYNLIYISYGYNLTPSDTVTLRDFLAAGKTVIMATESNDDDEVSFINKRMGSISTSTDFSEWNTNNGITTSSTLLNGRFGDGRSKTVGNNSSSGRAILGISSSNKIEILATKSDNSSLVVFCKEKNSKLYWAGDGGFAVHATDYPFLLNANLVPISGSFTTGSPTNVSNSILLMNIITQALIDAQ